MATAYAPGLPLPLRNALAALAIHALEDAGARAALAWLADPTPAAPEPLRPRLVDVHLVEADGRLLDVHRPHAARVRGHAARALRAASAYRARPDVPGTEPTHRAIVHAAALWNEQLFFEVHEVLEAVWKTATGATRQALQGVIQIGVAFHHHVHGNPRGARTLMHEGRERLGASGEALPTLDARRLLAETARWEAALDAGTATHDDAPPTLHLVPGS